MFFSLFFSVWAKLGLLIGGVCAEQVQLQEVAVCFGGQLMRGNRAQKVNASNYQAFDSPTYHKLALLGVEVDWQARYLLQVTLHFQYVPCLDRSPFVVPKPRVHVLCRLCCVHVLYVLCCLHVLCTLYESREWTCK